MQADDGDFARLLQIADAAFTAAQRAQLRAELNENLKRIWQDPTLEKKAGRGPDGNPYRAVPAAGHGTTLH